MASNTSNTFQPERDGPFYRSITHFKVAFNWPRSDDPVIRRRHQIYGATLKVISLFNFVGIVIHMIFSVKEHHYELLIEGLALGSGYLGAMISMTLFVSTERTWSNFLRRLLDFKKFGVPPTLNKIVKRFNFLSNVTYIYSYCGTSLYCFIEITDTAECERVNREEGRTEICGTVAPIYWPYGLTSTQKIIINVIQVVAIMMYSPQCGIFICFPSEAIEILNTRVKHASQLFLELFDNPDEDLEHLKKRMTFYIEYHIELLSLAEEFNNAFSSLRPCSAGGALVIAFILTQLLNTYNLGAITHVAGWIIGIFLLCRAGQILQDSLGAIGEAAYFSKWYELNNASIKRTIQLLILRGQKPTYLEAMPVGNHDFDFFARLSKTSYTYLTVMNQA
ncbi:uncharacterized protein LOC132704718 [Cylas formicarius]|uniref:uncharacterized protein LOC132704718 n=1 Tax=Cylas formicarius TaxID=197179 RepID=UPI0029585F98|nr:uncharacterized protein LOC132704718 [Cylas formicarius]